MSKQQTVKSGLYCTNLDCLKETEGFFKLVVRRVLPWDSNTVPSSEGYGSCILDIGLCVDCANDYKKGHWKFEVEAEEPFYEDENTNTNKEDK